MTTRAVLLVNLGSPASAAPADVRTYLDEFLMDPYVLDVPAPLRALLVKGLILPTRPATSADAYAKVWTAEGSPLIALSRRMRAALEAEMGIPVGLAMRYGEPSIGHGIDELLRRSGDAGEIVVVPLYPQYAMASTQTAIEAVGRVARARDLDVRFVPPFYDDPDYLDAVAARMRLHLPEDTQYVLFSYHGVPKRHLRKTDPTGAHCLRSTDCCEIPSIAHATCYRHQVIETTRGLVARLGLEPGGYGLSFQSRLGPGWLQPFTDLELAAFPGRGITRLAVACPSFVADCLETLEEIDIRGRRTFLSAGGTSFRYLPCPNDDERWIRALARLCSEPAAVKQ
jgi:ferrochelatase